MEKNEKLKKAFDNFKNELKNAILNEEVFMRFKPDSTPFYTYEVDVFFEGMILTLNISEFTVCHSNNTQSITGLFTEKKDIKALCEMVKKHVRPLNDEELGRIAKLEQQIYKIKTGAVLKPEGETKGIE